MEDNFYLVPDFITNVDEIINLVEKEDCNFSARDKGARDEFVNQDYGPSKMKTLFHFKMSDQLKKAIFKTVDKKEIEIMPDIFCINKYEPGSWLSRHRDSCGQYWKFYLIFLRTDKPHLKVYNEKYPEGKLIDEQPGARLEMPISLEHEVTLIEESERPKYSLVMGWTI
jgi:hypothetical protein